MNARVDVEELTEIAPAGPVEQCEFLVQRQPELLCMENGYWEVRTTCPHCHVAARDVLCRDHGTDVFAGSAANFVCPNCNLASYAPPAAWVRL